MGDFYEHIIKAKGNLVKARRTYISERKWFGDEWYTAWNTTDLSKEVEQAVKRYFMTKRDNA